VKKGMIPLRGVRWPGMSWRDDDRGIGVCVGVHPPNWVEQCKHLLHFWFSQAGTNGEALNRRARHENRLILIN
jgi:hypothetical protein